MKREVNRLGCCVVTVCIPVATTAFSQAGSVNAASSAGGLSVRTAANVPAGPVAAPAGSPLASNAQKQAEAREKVRMAVATPHISVLFRR